ncbi:MAG: exo-alpha-sialidase [Actinomycetota bacterium]
MEPRPVDPRPGDVVVLVGTAKGAYLLCADPGRSEWRIGGPWFAGRAVDAVCIDTRAGTPRMLAGTRSEHWGPSAFRSDDLGRTWREPDGPAVRFPAGTDAAVARVWQLTPGRRDEPDVVYAGVEPAALFRSDDGGATFQLVRGLWDHPHRPQWQPGGGGLCLHTIVPDPADGDRMWVAISTGGVYRTDDGGDTWRARNAGIRAPFLPGDEPPEFGQCVHKMALHPTRPGTLYLQHHWGVYRSDDAGDTWVGIGDSLPSDFGFPLVVHPHEPDTVYVVPLESDMVRLTPQGRPRVHRSRDGGATWEALGDGLPAGDAWLTVLRDGLTTDGLDPAGLYLGTRTGEVFASADGGERWRLLHAHLPPVLSVRAAQIAP